MAEFKDRIRQLRRERDLTQGELAEIMGFKTYTTVSKWESGENLPRGKELKMLSEFFKVSSDYILGISNERNIQNNPNSLTSLYNQMRNGKKIDKSISMENEKSELNSNLPPVPVAGRIAAGSPNIILEDIQGYLVAPNRKSLTEGYMYLEVTSDSMSHKFPVGSYALINTKTAIENGDIAAVKINGDESTLKQVKFDESRQYITLMPQSHNPSYKPVTIDLAKEELQIIGKAVGIYFDI